MAKTSSEQRLRNANLSLSDENFGPNMGKLNREKDTKANLAKAKAAEASNRNRSRYVTEGKNINNTRIADYADVAPKKKAPAPAEYKMPKSTTPDMDTTQGTTGSRVSFDAGEIKETPKSAPIEEKSWASVEESAPESSSSASSRFGSSNPMGMKKGGKVSSASSRGDGCAVRGKTKGRMV
jgi:hypothetical protein